MNMNNFLASFFPAIVDTAVKATLLLGMAWIAGLLLKNRPAALRHTVRVCALCGVLLLPALSSLAPSWHWKGLPLPPWPWVEQKAGIRPGKPDSAPAPGKFYTRSAALASPRVDASEIIQQAHYKAGSPAIGRSPVVSNWPQVITQVITIIWFLGLVAGGLRLLAGRRRFAALVNKSAPVDDPSWSLQVKEISFLLGIRRSVALLESKDTEVPLTTGAFRPKVILSPDHSEWSPLRRDAILHHELAHILRWDILAQALCQVAMAVYWFHPLVWLTVRAICAEREQACDDQVLAAGTRPSEYAHELLEIASSLRQPEFTAALAVARRSQLEGRVMALLNPKQQRGSISRKTTLAIALLTLCTVLPLAAIQTAEQRDKNTEQRKPAIPAPAQKARSAEADATTPAEPQRPDAVPAVPADDMVAPPAPPTPPVEGIPGGVRGGVQGGVHHGIRSMPSGPPALPVAPVAPTAPASPLPPPAPVPAGPKVPAIPKTPRAAPAAPQAVPHPAAATVAPRAAATAVKAATLRSLMASRALDQAATTADLRAKIATPEASVPAAASFAPEAAALRAQIAAVKATAVSMASRVAAGTRQAAFADNPCGGDSSHPHSMEINHDGNHKHWTASWSGQNCHVDLRSEGDIKFNQDTAAIESISPGGFLEASERHGDTLREIKVTPSSSGLQFALKVNGTEKPFDSPAKSWFSAFLTTVQSTTWQLAFPEPDSQ